LLQLRESENLMSYELECLDDQESECKGEVQEYLALSGSGLAYPRCEKHYGEYVERVQPQMDDINRRYPDTDTPPSWFDPTYAGERWNEDD
jgi:hypothetical protein